MTRTRLRLGAVLAIAIASVACEEDGAHTPLTVGATGTVEGFLFLDLNGDGQAGGGDEGVEGWTVRLRPPAGGGSFGTAVTDTAGFFAFKEVPIGGAVLDFDESLLGDTLELFGLDLDPFSLGAGETLDLRPGLRFMTFELAEVGALEPGIPLFTSGIALNSLNSAVRSLHIRLGDEYLRIEDITPTAIQPGDSVRVRGRTTRQAGQLYLDEGAVFRQRITGVVPQPVIVSTEDADGAKGGVLDAALIQIDSAVVLEVDLLDNDDVRVVIDDGTGPVEVLMRAFLGMDDDDFVPDSTYLERTRGLLVPYDDGGDTRWRVLPRTRSDFRVEDLEFPPPPLPSGVEGAVPVAALEAGLYDGARRVPGGSVGPGSGDAAREVPGGLPVAPVGFMRHKCGAGATERDTCRREMRGT